MENKTPVLLFLLLVLGISGCSNGLFSPLKNGAAPAIKPLPDQSIIIIYRNGNAGSAIPVILFMDNKKIGEIPIKTYYQLVVAPGRHIIRSRSDNESVFEVLAEKGKVYFVHQKVEMGFTRDYIELVEVGEGIGSAEIREYQQMKIP